MVVIVLTVPFTGIVTEVGTVNKVPTFGISTEGLLNESVIVDVVELMIPARVPLSETEIGELLPAAKGAVSVICNVKVVPEEMVMLVLLLTPEKLKVPKAGLPVVVMSVEDCGVYVRVTWFCPVPQVNV